MAAENIWEILQQVDQDILPEGVLSEEELGYARVINQFLVAEDHAVEAGPVGVPVSRGETLTPGETSHVNARKARASQHLAGWINSDLDVDRAPKIGVAASGGGYRAMLGTVGFVNAAKRLGLFDGITYFASLSGSTWALSTVLDKATRQDPTHPIDHWDPQTWVDHVNRRLLRHLANGDYYKAVGRALQHARAQGRPFTIVELYGLLFHFEFGSALPDTMEWRTLRELSEALDDSVPYPIFTCLIAEGDRWVEMSPFSVGLTRENYHIHPDCFGMSFDHGTSISGLNEPLFFLQGLWGSAFSASFEAAIAAGGIESRFAKAVLWFALRCTRGIRVARVPNFLRGTDHTLGHETTLSVVDAGAGAPPTSFNLALPPLIERPHRGIDIVIALEMSAGCSLPETGDGEIVKASQYFAGTRFPAGLQSPIPADAAHPHSHIRVLKGPNPGDPWTIYLPIKSHDPNFNLDTVMPTTAFQYPEDVVRRYWNLIETLVNESLDEIKAVILEKWTSKAQ